MYDHPLELLEAICALSRKGGEAIMPFYKQEFAIETKADTSPVTEADLAAHHAIVPALEKLTPDIPVISEESESHINPPKTDLFWLVDPLDGTKSFIRHSGQFTVNIGLIDNNRPVMGAIFIPAQDVLYGGLIGHGAFVEHAPETRHPIQCRTANQQAMTVVVSHSHLNQETQEYVDRLQVKKSHPSASSLKFCIVAEGKADVYPRFGPTMEWDTAAGHAILEAAGGSVTTPEGKPFLYNKPEFRNGYFIASGGI